MKHAPALHRDIQIVTGLGEVALFNNPVDGARFNADTDLNARRFDIAFVRRIDPLAGQILIQQVLEFSPLPLETGGVHIGQVIGYDLDIELLGQHAGGRDA